MCRAAGIRIVTSDLRGVIFDLDGVITDTAEHHFQAWARVCAEEGIHFDRRANEALRGVGRRESLESILNGRPIAPELVEEVLARKNDYYMSGLAELTPADVLPGVADLITELRTAGIKVGLVSASRNTSQVLDRLGNAAQFDAVVDGNVGVRGKPAPDGFRLAARLLDVPAGCCLVVEDAAVGIAAGLSAGMWTLGVGPAARVGHAHARVDDLTNVDLAALRALLESASWTVAEPVPSPRPRHAETVFTIGNGSFCVRGSYEEGHPGQAPASFMHRVWDDMPVQLTELVNLPRWYGVDLWVAGERLRLDRGELLGYRRWLDLRTGVLARRFTWRSGPGAPAVEIAFERFVGLDAPHGAAVRVRISADEKVRVRAKVALDARVENTGLVHLDVIDQSSAPERVRLLVRTRSTRIDVGVAAALKTHGEVLSVGEGDSDGVPSAEATFAVGPGRPASLTSFVAIVPALDADDPLSEATAEAAQACAAGWDALRVRNDAAWGRFWDAADIEVGGDPEAQIAIRYNLFQLAIAAPRFTDKTSIGAKTLSGFGYRQHVFWDTEIFMLPVFTFTQPQIARNMLMYRWHTLAGARAKAIANGFAGAQFPWESAETGDDVTPTWVPDGGDRRRLIRIWTGDIEIHITADIAFTVMQYWRATGDDEFMTIAGAELVLDGARFWARVAALEEDHHYHLRDVIGPDEYHDHVDDNAYTNAFARWHLRTATDVWFWLCGHDPDGAVRLGAELEISEAELGRWADVAERMFVADGPGGLIEQFEGYFDRIDVAPSWLRDPARVRSAQELLGVSGCARTQCIKQPDVMMLAYLLPELFDAEALSANYAYYDPRTDHEFGSSLGPAISAVLACRAGDPDRGYAHFMRAARADLADVRGNAADGIHGASAGGLWQAVVFGFAGLALTDEGFETRPMLPAAWQRLVFNITVRGVHHRVEVARSGLSA